MTKSLEYFGIGVVFLVLLTTGQVKGQEAMKLAAVGRTAFLGSLYNSRTEEFTGVSILKADPTLYVVHSQGVPGTNTRYGVEKSYLDKASLLDIKASLSLSLLSGLISATGSGRYMNDEKKTASSLVGSFLYEITTKEEHLELFYANMKDFIAMDVLEKATETHVVIGIGYGANVIVKFQDTNSMKSSVTRIEAALERAIDIVVFHISLKTTVGIGESDLSSFSEYQIEIHGDFSFGTEDYPTNVTDVVKLLSKIPPLVAQSNEGRGKILQFHLLPIEKVRQFFLPKTNLTSGVKGQRSGSMSSKDGDDGEEGELPEEEVALQLQVLEEASTIKIKLNDLYQSMMGHSNILNSADLQAIQSLKNSLLNSTQTFRSSLKRGIIDYRTARGSTAKRAKIAHLRELERGFRQGREDEDASLELIETAVDNNFNGARLKIEMVDFLESQGAIWVGRSDSTDTSAIKAFQKIQTTDTTICTIHWYDDYFNDSLAFAEAVFEATGKNWAVLIVDCGFPKQSCELAESKDKICSVLFTPPRRTFGQDRTNLVDNGEF